MKSSKIAITGRTTNRNEDNDIDDRDNGMDSEQGQIQIFNQLAKRPHGLRYWFMNRLLDSANDLRVGGVDIDDWHTAGWGVPIVLLKYALFWTCWLYFVAILTVNEMQTPYLSLQGSDPNVQICQEIPRQVQLTAQGDMYGYWSTDTRYSINASAYEISCQVISSVLACIYSLFP